MAEMVLPGVYIEVRPEGLIVPDRITVGNIGMVGTASKGPIGLPVIIGSYAEAREVFGTYDPWINGQSELTLVRALEIAYAHGATTVIALRVAGSSKAKASYTLQSASGSCVSLTAKSEGTWGNNLLVNVWNAEEHPLIEKEEHAGQVPITLNRPDIIKSARNRIIHFNDNTGVSRSLKILYDDDAAVPASGEVKINRMTREMTFGDMINPADKVTATYLVDKTTGVKVTLRYGSSNEVYTVVDGNDLVADIKERSALVDAVAVVANAYELPSKSITADAFASFKGGDNGASGADYKTDGLDKLLNEPVHIIVAAGQDNTFGDELDAHCQQASTDAIKRDRIAVVGSSVGATFDTLRGHTLSSDRLIFVAPGIKMTDAAATPPKEVSLPGAYAATAVAGLLAGFSAHISLTNKTLRVGGLDQRYTAAQLSQLVQSRVLALEERQGFRIVKGITTSTNTAWHQITTRRIVDFAKYGVRSAALPYIGLLNNDRVRSAMRTTINSFLTEMVDDEMLISYDLAVTATRDDERKGIARVTLVLRPTFSIDFIKVTMFLE